MLDFLWIIRRLSNAAGNLLILVSGKFINSLDKLSLATDTARKACNYQLRSALNNKLKVQAVCLLQSTKLWNRRHQ